MRTQKQFEAAEGELVQLFTTPDAMKGQSYERNGDATHDPRSTEAALLHLVQSGEWSSIKKIRTTFERCTGETKTVAARAFTRRRFVGLPSRELYYVDKTKETKVDEWSLLCAAFPRYTGLVPYTRAAFLGYQRDGVRKIVKLEPSIGDIVDFLATAARNNNRRSLVKAIEAEVLTGVRAVLVEYDGFLRQRIDGEKAIAAARAYEIRGEADRRHRRARMAVEA